MILYDYFMQSQIFILLKNRILSKSFLLFKNLRTLSHHLQAVEEDHLVM
jgi:hypothetical protein